MNSMTKNSRRGLAGTTRKIKESKDRPIIITPEMMEAGIYEFADYHPAGWPVEDCVPGIYNAMRKIEIAQVHVGTGNQKSAALTISPAMLEAGILEFIENSYEGSTAEDVVTAVFTLMRTKELDQEATARS